MNRNMTTCAMGVALVALCGCTTVQRNTSVGAGAGAVGGTLIGGAVGAPVQGAVIGGVAGAGAGYALTPERER